MFELRSNRADDMVAAYESQYLAQLQQLDSDSRLIHEVLPSLWPGAARRSTARSLCGAYESSYNEFRFVAEEYQQQLDQYETENGKSMLDKKQGVAVDLRREQEEYIALMAVCIPEMI